MKHDERLVEAVARAEYIEDAARRMRACVSDTHASDAYELERRRAAERWDDPNIADGWLGLVPRLLWRANINTALDAINASGIAWVAPWDATEAMHAVEGTAYGGGKWHRPWDRMRDAHLAEQGEPK